MKVVERHILSQEHWKHMRLLAKPIQRHNFLCMVHEEAMIASPKVLLTDLCAGRHGVRSIKWQKADPSWKNGEAECCQFMHQSDNY